MPGRDRRAPDVRGERIAREFIDLETPRFVPVTGSFPDPYALKRVSPERFAAAVLAAVPPPPPGQITDRISWMAARLRELESRIELILFVCSILDWPWIRDAYCHSARSAGARDVLFADPDVRRRSATLIFVLGELPYITGLYERGRRELTPDDNLSVDGVKEMVLDARERLRTKHPKIAERITPQLLSIYFRYIRNLVAAGSAADARPVHPDRRGPADRGRRLRPGAGRDRPRVRYQPVSG